MPICIFYGILNYISQLKIKIDDLCIVENLQLGTFFLLFLLPYNTE